jgi:membrane protease YdiL (CAAX protease family)
MTMSKKAALHVSLIIIVLYWFYELFVVKHSGNLSGSFSDFAIRIALNKSIQLAVIILLLRIEKVNWHEMGFTSNNLRKQFFFGILFGFIMFLLFNLGLSNVLNSVFPKPAGSGSILAFFSDPQNLYIWLAIGILGGGLAEEVMRIFMLTRFQTRFGKAGLYFALVCSSFVFGMGHLYQGMGTAISTGISGLILGGMYIRRRSAIELITTHAFNDVLAILGAFQMAGHH